MARNVDGSSWAHMLRAAFSYLFQSSIVTPWAARSLAQATRSIWCALEHAVSTAPARMAAAHCFMPNLYIKLPLVANSYRAPNRAIRLPHEVNVGAHWCRVLFSKAKGFRV